eukprot:scaffold33958_cov136-Isochrysis_galbana.AAC.6
MNRSVKVKEPGWSARDGKEPGAWREAAARQKKRDGKGSETDRHNKQNKVQEVTHGHGEGARGASAHRASHIVWWMLVVLELLSARPQCV